MRKTLFVLLAMTLVMGAGCDQPVPKDSPIGSNPGLVPLDLAEKAADEPVQKGPLSLPCLQFKNREGFMKWADAYTAGKEQMALALAKKIDLPDKADSALLDSIRTSYTEGSGNISFCSMHKGLNNFTWAIQKDKTSRIYAYHQGQTSDLEIPVDPGGENLFFCLPREINTSELTWVCKLDQSKDAKRIYINRKTEEMKAFNCPEGSQSEFCKNP